VKAQTSSGVDQGNEVVEKPVLEACLGSLTVALIGNEAPLSRLTCGCPNGGSIYSVCQSIAREHRRSWRQMASNEPKFLCRHA